MAKQISNPQPLVFLVSLLTLCSSSGLTQLHDNIPQPNPTPTLITIPAAIPVNPPTATSPSVLPPFVTVPPPTLVNPLPPSTTIPLTSPPALTNPPTASAQNWCVAKTGATPTALQYALDYACGMGGADCSPIQPSGNCYNPNNAQSHASYAFNSYYHKNPLPTSCDFKGTAMLVNVNPSTASCIYSSSSSSSLSSNPPSATNGLPSPPTTTSSLLPPPATTSSLFPPPATTSSSLPPPATTSSSLPPPATASSSLPPPATPSSSLPPFVLNSSYPDPSTPSSIYGSSPPPGTSTSESISIGLRPVFAFIVLVPFVVSRKLCNA